MNISRFSYLLAFVTTVAIPIGVLPVQAQVRSAVTTAQAGNSSAGANRNDSILVDPQGNVGRLSKSLDCSLLKQRTSCASASLEVRPTGGIALVKIGGRTLFSKRFTRSGSANFAPIVLDIFRIQPFEVFNVGIARVKLSGNAGAGAQFGGTWNFRRVPLQADLNGAAQTWGNATGKLRADILFGAASAQVDAIVNFFNSTLNVDLHATPSGLQNSRASFTIVLWELWIKLKAKVLGATVGTSTIVHETGPTLTKTLL